ncbi:hypothetical protein TNCV_1503531 [Trichonephila clavipes]|uniref:Uncharacterized protein n=1 Tax=Trichonephila clavipes TaxID=2585209 RepID=A0A8X6V8H1_TRICX|nr:hypothetical protein TNCV_1503531 [Trichonephila clavipes]
MVTALSIAFRFCRSKLTPVIYIRRMHCMLRILFSRGKYIACVFGHSVVHCLPILPFKTDTSNLYPQDALYAEDSLFLREVHSMRFMVTALSIAFRFCRSKLTPVIYIRRTHCMLRILFSRGKYIACVLWSQRCPLPSASAFQN